MSFLHTGVEIRSAEDDTREGESSLVREVSEKMVCSACRCPFTNREEQREHYKLDWHRFNLRQKMTVLPPLTAEEFERKTGAGDLSSISGSESDSEEENSDSDAGVKSRTVSDKDMESSGETPLTAGRLSSKLVFQNSAGDYLLVYRCILKGKFQLDDEHDAGSSLKAITNKTAWVILMTGGGHFAGAVFEGKQVLLHKTFHRYTVRAKRGTAQGLRDSQNRSHAPRSAGAALRRHNEAALVKEIQDLLVTWAEHLKAASKIFIRAPSYNKTIFFGGRGGPLDKKDPRICTIPFATRRATFREVQRVHEVLSTVHVYGKKHEFITQLFCKIYEISHSFGTEPKSIEAEGKEEELPEATPVEDLPHEVQSKSKRKRKVQSKKQVDESCDYSLRDALFTACKVGDVEALRALLQLPVEKSEGQEHLESKLSDGSSPLLNKPIDASGFTLLHVATAAAQKAVIGLLLDAGADPSCRDNKGQTPYIVAPDKDTRNVFRKYMGDNPDKYDYSKAQIPGPLATEIELKKLEKKKAQKAQKKQREKEQKEEKRKQELEAEEKKQFASLTDREKRALAAEKRFAAQVAAKGASISNIKRCWLCGETLLGKIPFQYLDYSFCTPRCVQAHRKANVPPGKT
uniref:Ankyrin repeat and zinc finger peptidyl tRNA hydrolase 1 n=1 Tax=Oreochromis niloticus TaxID=8128 RepID=A0A669F4F0_ORENI